MGKALGFIETKGLVSSVEAADSMVKAADVTIINQEMVDAALVTILIEGDVSAVQAAVDAGKSASERVGEFVTCFVIPHPDDETKDMLTKQSLSNKQKVNRS